MSAENPQPQTAGEFTATAFNSLTLRDYFAAKFAAVELIPHEESNKALAKAAVVSGVSIERRIAQNAYTLADAMLAERERSK
jgi:hypothetical protein